MNLQKLVRPTVGLICIILLSSGCGPSAPEFATPTSAVQNPTPERPTTLTPRAIFPKPTSTTVDPEHFSSGQIILKFHEGTHIRLRSGSLTFDPGIITSAERLLLERVGLLDEQIQRDLDQINQILHQSPPLNISRLFLLQDEEQLAANKAEGEAMSGDELADLDLYYNLTFEAPDVSRAEDLINWLNSLASVEVAYAQPIPTSPDGDLPPRTVIRPPLSQGYLNEAPHGINAVYAWTYPGGRGAGVNIVDMETGWHLDHEDLPAPEEYFFGNGLNLGDESHGTAVLGVIAARDNGFGATGIVPDASFGWSSPILVSFPNFVYFVAAGIDKGVSTLSFGDILIIEQHYSIGPPGVTLPCPSTCNCSQSGYGPVENYGADFDAIRNATARGIIVVEAAGNGQLDLDAANFEGRFDLNIRDSRAILVGAGSAPILINGTLANSRIPLCFTNFGSRVDVQGWGNNVETLGYGGPPNGPEDPELRIDGGDARQWYTRSFGGTSSASPIVAGAVAAIQGIRIARGDQRLGPLEMRELLRNTGTHQAPDPRQIGPLPDLRRAIHSILPNSAEFVSQSYVPPSIEVNHSYPVWVKFRNTGTTTWTPTENYFLGSQNESDNTIWGTNRISLPHVVSPGDEVTFNFTMSAPSSGNRYNFQWRIVQDGVEWFGDWTANVVVNVLVPGNYAKFVSQSVPRTMPAFEQIPVSITLRNVGTTTWTRAGQYQLGSQNPQDNTTWGMNRVSLPVDSVPPGSDVTFRFTVGSLTPVNKNFQWRMVQEDVEWFGPLTPNVPIWVYVCPRCGGP